MHRNLGALLVVAVLLATVCACSLDITPSFTDVGVAYTQDGRLILTGKTTLPDGAKLSAMLLQLKPERKGLYMDVPMDYPTSVAVVVKDGRFTSWFPSATKNGLKAGTYGLQIVVAPNQDRVLGVKNAGLAGPGVVRESDGSKSYVWETTVNLPDIAVQATPAPPSS